MRIASRLLTGGLEIKEREEVVSSFQSNPETRVLLATTWVAGEGLTLTAANHVIFLNEWWNPSTNAQARDRIVRIGQKRGVQVYRFRCQGTIEEALGRVLARKQDLFEGLVDRWAETAGAERLAPQRGGGGAALSAMIVPKRSFRGGS